jgi:hypothetical protein
MRGDGGVEGGSCFVESFKMLSVFREPFHMYDLKPKYYYI